MEIILIVIVILIIFLITKEILLPYRDMKILKGIDKLYEQRYGYRPIERLMKDTEKEKNKSQR
jgi:hypothetical protein